MCMLQGLYDVTFSPCNLLTPAFYPVAPHMEPHMRYSQHLVLVPFLPGPSPQARPEGLGSAVKPVENCIL